MKLFNYLIENKEQIISLCIEHIKLTSLALLIAIIIGVPIGILISYKKKLNKPVLGITSVAQAIPSMALLGFMIPFLGIGTIPAIVVVVLYSLLPIIKNTYTGISNIPSSTIEAATGIGLTKAQILTKIQIPEALPIIMAGVRISSVSAVGLMTMAAFIGGGGLGYLIFSGIRTVNNYQILAGAIPACILALLVDYFFGAIEKLVNILNNGVLVHSLTQEYNAKLEVYSYKDNIMIPLMLDEQQQCIHLKTMLDFQDPDQRKTRLISNPKSDKLNSYGTLDTFYSKLVENTTIPTHSLKDVLNQGFNYFKKIYTSQH